VVDGVLGQLQAHAVAPPLRVDRDAAHEGVLTVLRQLVAGAALHATVLVAQQPEPHGWRVRAAQRQVRSAQEGVQVRNVGGSQGDRSQHTADATQCNTRGMAVHHPATIVPGKLELLQATGCRISRGWPARTPPR
jgi:hypothetical protein